MEDNIEVLAIFQDVIFILVALKRPYLKKIEMIMHIWI